VTAVRVGTCSWADESLVKAWYPSSVRSAEARLRHYAGLFDTVEVNSSYYALPSADAAAAWARRTPEGFVFHVKAFGVMTRHPVKAEQLPPDLRDAVSLDQRGRVERPSREFRAEIFRRFSDAIRPLKEAGKLGAVFLQFPRWVFPSNENRELILDARRRLGVEVAAEFRNASWFNEKNAERTLRFLADNKVPYVMVDGPQGLKSSIPPLTAVTSPELAVIRFHGRRADLWEKPNIPVVERFRYLYDEDQLADWVPRIREVAKAAKRAHVLFNNCFGNYGTTNARELAALLREQLGD